MASSKTGFPSLEPAYVLRVGDIQRLGNGDGFWKRWIADSFFHIQVDIGEIRPVGTCQNMIIRSMSNIWGTDYICLILTELAIVDPFTF